MLGIVANHPDHAFTLNDFAFGTDLFNGRFNLHVFLMAGWVRLFGAVDNPTPVEIIGGDSDSDFIPRQNFDKVHSHFSRDVGQNPVTVGQFHPEHGIRQGFDYRTLDFNGLFFCHNSL